MTTAGAGCSRRSRSSAASTTRSSDWRGRPPNKPARQPGRSCSRCSTATSPKRNRPSTRCSTIRRSSPPSAVPRWRPSTPSCASRSPRGRSTGAPSTPSAHTSTKRRWSCFPPRCSPSTKTTGTRPPPCLPTLTQGRSSRRRAEVLGNAGRSTEGRARPAPHRSRPPIRPEGVRYRSSGHFSRSGPSCGGARRTATAPPVRSASAAAISAASRTPVNGSDEPEPVGSPEPPPPVDELAPLVDPTRVGEVVGVVVQGVVVVVVPGVVVDVVVPGVVVVVVPRAVVDVVVDEVDVVVVASAACVAAVVVVVVAAARAAAVVEVVVWLHGAVVVVVALGVVVDVVEVGAVVDVVDVVEVVVVDAAPAPPSEKPPTVPMTTSSATRPAPTTWAKRPILDRCTLTTTNLPMVGGGSGVARTRAYARCQRIQARPVPTRWTGSIL